MTTITPDRLRDMRTLLDAAPVRYSGAAADACDAAADLIEAKDREIIELTKECERLGYDASMTAELRDRMGVIVKERDEWKAKATGAMEANNV